MNLYAITRNTHFVTDTKVVFDIRDLIQNKEAFIDAAKEVFGWEFNAHDTEVEYCVEKVPCSCEPIPRIILEEFEDKSVWIWTTEWFAVDYNGHELHSIFEGGSEPQYSLAVDAALKSYNTMNMIRG